MRRKRKARREYPRKWRFNFKQWGAMWQGYFMPGMPLSRTRKEAWAKILLKIRDHHERYEVPPESIEELKARGWSVCRVAVSMNLVKPLPSKKKIEKWQRHCGIGDPRLSMYPHL